MTIRFPLIAFVPLTCVTFLFVPAALFTVTAPKLKRPVADTKPLIPKPCTKAPAFVDVPLPNTIVCVGAALINTADAKLAEKVNVEVVVFACGSTTTIVPPVKEVIPVLP